MCPWLPGMREASLPLSPDSSGPGDLTGDARVVRGGGGGGGGGALLTSLRTMRMLVEGWFLSTVASGQALWTSRKGCREQRYRNILGKRLSQPSELILVFVTPHCPLAHTLCLLCVSLRAFPALVR